MKKTTELVGDDVGSAAAQANLIRRLAHDLRQPLSNIECIGYYLEMVLGELEPELQKQCDMLRRMVQQAHWMLEDASLAASVGSAKYGPVSLSDEFARLGGEMALHDQRSLELLMDGDVVVLAPVSETAAFCSLVISFFRNVALAVDPIRVTSVADKDVCLEISAEVLGDLDELMQLVGPAQSTGLHAYVELACGSLEARAGNSRLTLAVWLPRPE